MKIIKINKSDWPAGLEKSRKYYLLIGPAKENNGTSKFRELHEGEVPDLELSDTTLSPKSLVFPHSEVMFEYTTDPGEEDCNLLKVPGKNYLPRAVIGIRPYDAAALLIEKANFDTPEYRDPYWCDAFEACIFIGLAVTNPSQYDFSTSTNSGPFNTGGLDILLIDQGDSFLARVISEKGDSWLTAAGFETEAESNAEGTIQEMAKSAIAKIATHVAFDKIKSKSILELYNADFWDDVSFSCINCGICTYVCPTCWCFDIQDENRHKKGKRFKNWDSCMYPLFTRHTTGHNPRDTKVHRVRQRFMHKLKYFLDDDGETIMCVGCGRCIEFCPVNIDIRAVCELMNS